MMVWKELHYLRQLTGTQRLNDIRPNIFDRLHTKAHYEIIADTDGEDKGLSDSGRISTQQTRRCCECINSQVGIFFAQHCPDQYRNATAEAVASQGQGVVSVRIANSIQKVAFLKTGEQFLRTNDHSTMSRRVRGHSVSIEIRCVCSQIRKHVTETQTSSDRYNDLLLFVVKQNAEW